MLKNEELAVLLEIIAHRMDRILFPCVRKVLNQVYFEFGVPWEKGTRTQYHTLAEFKVFVNSVHSFSLNVSILKASRNTISKGKCNLIDPHVYSHTISEIGHMAERPAAKQCPRGAESVPHVCQELLKPESKAMSPVTGGFSQQTVSG